MNKVEKIDVFLTQSIQNTININNGKSNVNIGRINEYLTYKNDNPFDIDINKNNDVLNIKIDLSQKFDLQYVHRIYKTPFYLTFLSNDELQLKILDFYEWYPNTSVYRLIILKRVARDTSDKKINLQFNFDEKIINKNNQIICNNMSFAFSGKAKVDSHLINSDLQIDSDTSGFAKVVSFDTDQNSSITLDSVINKFYTLYNVCKSNHISKYIVTKNIQAEQELDLLWNEQKYILPDLNFDKQIMYSKNISVLNFWINDFFGYFDINNEVGHQNLPSFINQKSKFTSSYILDYLPSTKEIYQNYINSSIIDFDIRDSVQNWWDVYSLPIFENIYKNIFITNPAEVFCVYLLAIRYNLPWVDLLYETMTKIIIESENSHLINFLFLLTFFNKRITKFSNDKGDLFYSPGYHLDNNYKSLNTHSNKYLYEVTKFSNTNYIKFSAHDGLTIKIDKLCILLYDEKNKKITIKPYMSGLNNISIKQLEIKLDDFYFNFPLIWNAGSIELNHIRFRWILKKNRFQFTFFSNKTTDIQLNGKPLKFVKGKKVNFYLEVIPVSPEIKMSIFNRMGGSLISKLGESNPWLMISGHAVGKFGTLTNNILYSSKIRKHKLFTDKSNTINKNIIQINKDSDKLNFYIKHFSESLNITSIKNQFVDKLLHLNFVTGKKLLILIDNNFSRNIQEIIMFFNSNFGYQPEFMLKHNCNNIDFNTNLVIEIKQIKRSKDIEQIELVKTNWLTIHCKNVSNGLENLKNLIIENLRKIPQ